ncbi:hypothetical protein RhiirA5_416609 [Rhizophagus irregularis]|uniref:Uncharacterized protein n=2 Tax=Rhizophagus irregularis TaxID=588596 RepID=A0A2N0PPD3_9GLOM|nr:hypothetical protein RhiirA5_416609 [Rhizophagus irregularis]CAB5188676.1 unnamed protein product [Rhizophagus irregularis]CAB5204501.1 unnamed protein product [Rhizophagus irregularis]
MNLRSIIWLTFISTFLLFTSSNVNAGFGSYAACAGACGTAYHTCMGVSILSTYGAGAIAAYPACQAGFAACSNVCIAMFLAPTP